jgi:hypothetical protein
MKTKLLLTAVLFTIAFSNCSKEKEKKTNTLTSKTWKRAWTDMNPTTNPQEPFLYYAVQNCEKDDTFTFNGDGSLIIDRNDVRCDQNELRVENQSYSINRQTKELVIGGTTYTLAEESNKQIKYYTVIPTPSGFQYLIFLLQ